MEMAPASQRFITEPVQVPLLGTVSPGPHPKIRRLACSLELTLVVITAANVFALALIMGMAEVLEWTWPRAEASVESMPDRAPNT
jgi:hypothetical protein